MRYRASTGQEAVWIAERLAPAPGAYVEAFAWRLTPAPDATRLGGALATLVARHEALRTALVEEGGELVQRVRPADDDVPLLVAPGWDAERLAGWLREPIDPAAGAPLRAALVPGGGGALLGLALHHAFVDSWALERLLAELSQAYAAAEATDAPAAQFGPWAEADRAAPAPPVPDELVALLRHDAGAAGPPAPGDGSAREAPALRVLAGETLREAARARRVTPFELVACAATRALRAELGPSDAVLGAVMSRRDSAEAQRMLGYCATSVPIACGPQADLEAVAHGVRLARRVRHVPPRTLVARVGRRGAPGRQPLFDALLAYERGAPAAPALPGIAAEPVHVPARAAKFTLALAVRETADAVHAGAEWAAGEVPDDAAGRVLARLAEELEAVCAEREPVRRRPAARPAVEAAGGGGADGAAAAPARAPLRWHDGLELEVAAAWERVLGRAPRALDEGFFEAGGDSLAAIHLCAALGRGGLARIEPARLVEAATVPGIAAAIRAGTGGPEDPCLVRLRGGEGPPIVLVHPVGGTVMWYAPLVPLLRHPAPLWAIQARGLTPGQPFHSSIREMAADYAELIAQRFDAPPLVVGGYSLGGTVGAELARCLEARGRAAELLLLLDTSMRPARRSDDPHYAVRVLVEKALRLSFDWRAIADEPRARQADAILAAAQDAGRLPTGFDTERLRRMIEIYEHNSGALERHEPAPYDGRALLLRTEGEEAAADPTLGWGPLLRALEVRVAPGDHFSLLDPDNAPGVARLIDDALAGAPVGG